MNALSRWVHNSYHRWQSRRLRHLLPLDVYWVMSTPLMFQSLYVLAKLDIPDILKHEGPHTAEALAEKTDSSAPDLFRIMRALVTLGFLTQDENDRFAMTPYLEPLCSDAAFCLKHWFLISGQVGWNACAQLLPAVQQGKFPFELAYNMECWDYYEKDQEMRRIFDLGMGVWTVIHAPAIVEAIDLSNTKELVDVGGGRGTLMIATLKANPHLKGVVFDRPEAVDICQSFIDDAGLTDRCQVIGGDFREAVPASEAYVIKHALHDWTNEFALIVLKNIRAAIKPGGRLVIIDAVMEYASGNGRVIKWLDVFQMVGTTGHVRTEPEFRELLAEAGFELKGITTSRQDDCNLLECAPA